MDTDTKTEGDAVDTKNDGGEGGEVVSVPKKDYDTLNQTLGSLKRELKDLKKAQEGAKETPQTKPDDALLQRVENLSLRQAGITHPDDAALARDTAKKWNLPLEVVLEDADFKVKLEREQTKRANSDATTGIRGSGSPSQAKNTPEYWLALGRPPTADEANRQTRAKVLRAFMAKEKGSGGKFYND